MSALKNACRSIALVALVALAGCSTGQVPAPKTVREPEPEVTRPETEADRAEQRRKASAKLIPPGTNCLPEILRGERALRLELAAIGESARLCAIDVDRKRLLGPVACWTVDLAASTLTYQEPAPFPARGYAVKLDGACARGYCLPQAPDARIAELAWSPDGRKVAVLAGARVHLFDAASQRHESSFTLDRGMGEVTALHHVGTHLLVEARDDQRAPVWVYEVDGTLVGPITSAGPRAERTLSTHGGALALLDAGRVAIGERGFEELTIYELATGARSTLTRKLPKRPQCKPDEIEAFWRDPDAAEVAAPCRDSLTELSGHLIGATVIAGRTNFLALLRDKRVGQLAVLDAKTLVEKRAINLPWCPEATDEDDEEEDDDDEEEDDE